MLSPSLLRNVTWLLLLFLLTIGCTSPTKNESTQENPPSEPKRVDQGKLEYITTLPDGRVVSMRMNARNPEEMVESGPPQPVIIRYSHDNGLNWTEGDTAFSYSEGKGVVYGGFALADRKGGLHCFGIRYFRLPQNNTPGRAVLFHNRSEDGGKPWTKPQPVDFGHDYTGSFNTVIELSSGRILLALSYPTTFLEERGEHTNQIVTVYSDDSGDTWQVGSDDISVPLGEFKGHPGALEPVMVQLMDRRVWMIIRTQQRRFFQAYSSDEGETWSQTSPTDFKAPNAPGGILRLSDGRLVFCWNDLSRYPEGKVEGSGRQYLHVAISNDDGKTWSPSKLIAKRENGENPNTNVAYPYLTETKDNHILISYHRVGNREGVTWWHPIVEVIRIDPDWITFQEDTK